MKPVVTCAPESGIVFQDRRLSQRKSVQLRQGMTLATDVAKA
jgi:hypothetical protein